MAHDRDCRISPFFPHCNCGEAERVERLAFLEQRVVELESQIEALQICDSCEERATRHVCRHHCRRD